MPGENTPQPWCQACFYLGKPGVGCAGAARHLLTFLPPCILFYSYFISILFIFYFVMCCIIFSSFLLSFPLSFFALSFFILLLSLFFFILFHFIILLLFFKGHLPGLWVISCSGSHRNEGGRKGSGCRGAFRAPWDPPALPSLALGAGGTKMAKLLAGVF